MSGGRTTWLRNEFPGTYRGHILVADLGGERWSAWELPDGQWALSYGTMDIRKPQAVYGDWTQARKTAERLRTRSPRAENPFHPLVAAAAGAGAAAVVRNAMLANPAPSHFVQACAASSDVASRLPRSWMVEPVQCLSDGTARAVVRPGFAAAARQRLAGLPFQVRVIERTPRPQAR